MKSRESHIENVAPPTKITVPPEVEEIIYKYQKEKGLSDQEINLLVPKWYPHPALEPTPKRLTREELQANQIDAVKVMELFLGNKIFDGTLRIMDVANGCGHQCDTCFADAVLPSALFSSSSLNQLFGNENFLRMLSPDSFRVGSAGDIADHPEAVKIAGMILEKTTKIDKQRLEAENTHHVLKIFTNFRHRDEEKIVELVRLAEKSNDRLDIVISLPNNITDTVNKQFKDFALRHAKILQLEPDNPFRLMSDFTYSHQELLTEKPSKELRQKFIEYMGEKIEKNNIINYKTNKLYSRSEIADLIDRHIKFIPKDIQQKEGIENYIKCLARQIKKDELNPGKIKNPHVKINDVRLLDKLITYGRTVSEELLVERGQLLDAADITGTIRQREFYNRGLCKTFLNPDGLWIQIYTTPIESHTSRVYAPINSKNVELLSKIPYHQDFPKPPHWPGRVGAIEFRTEEFETALKNYPDLKGKMNVLNSD